MSIEPFIKCSDIGSSVDFYTGPLGFRVIQAPDPDPEAFMSKYALLERNGDLIHLSAHRGDGVYGGLIYIRVTDIDVQYQGVVNSGLKLIQPGDYPGITMPLTNQTWGMREFSVKDPDGNKCTVGQSL